MLALVSALIFMLSATWSLLGMFGEAFIILLLYRQLGEKPAGLERLGRETVKKDFRAVDLHSKWRLGHDFF